jgi:hypothetical protein
MHGKYNVSAVSFSSGNHHRVREKKNTKINSKSHFKFPISTSFSVYQVAYFQRGSLAILFEITVSPSSLNAQPSWLHFTTLYVYITKNVITATSHLHVQVLFLAFPHTPPIYEWVKNRLNSLNVLPLSSTSIRLTLSHPETHRFKTHKTIILLCFIWALIWDPSGANKFLLNWLTCVFWWNTLFHVMSQVIRCNWPIKLTDNVSQIYNNTIIII